MVKFQKLKVGDTIGIVSPASGDSADVINYNISSFKNLGFKIKEGKYLRRKNDYLAASDKERAEDLIEMFKNKEVKAIIAYRGGYGCIRMLPYLDMGVIKKNPKILCGYSDLTVLLNAIYSQCDITTYNYQLRNLIGKFKEEQMQNFKASFIEGKEDIFNLDYKWINGSHLEGIVVGGNIRCLLKLAGTKYMPDFKDKILFLESFSGNSAKMVTYITQYKNLGVFNEVKGIILGEFTEMERENLKPDIVEILKRVIGEINIPILKTRDLGHGADAKCIPIGKYLIFK